MGQKASLKRLVLDTNVLVSALLFEGPAQELLVLWQKDAIRLLGSAATIRELSRVLAYPKFKLSEEEISELLNEDFLPFLEPVAVSDVPRVVAEDPADDAILACAVAGRADALVSGDRHLLRLGSHHGIPILSVRDCLERLGSV